jgi:hypothetical protein
MRFFKLLGFTYSYDKLYEFMKKYFNVYYINISLIGHNKIHICVQYSNRRSIINKSKIISELQKTFDNTSITSHMNLSMENIVFTKGKKTEPRYSINDILIRKTLEKEDKENKELKISKDTEPIIEHLIIDRKNTT